MPRKWDWIYTEPRDRSWETLSYYVTSGKSLPHSEFILSCHHGVGSDILRSLSLLKEKCYDQLCPGIRPTFSQSPNNPFCKHKGETKALGVHLKEAGVMSLQAASGFEHPDKRDLGDWGRQVGCSWVPAGTHEQGHVINLSDADASNLLFPTHHSARTLTLDNISLFIFRKW